MIGLFQAICLKFLFKKIKKLQNMNLTPSPRHVLLLVTDLEIGGTPLQIYRLAKGLAEIGVQVTVTCLGTWGPVADKIRDLGLPVYPLGARSVADLGICVKLPRLIARLKPDICHSFLMHSNILTRLAGGLVSGPRIISTICTMEREKHWHMVLEYATCRLADKIVCVSNAVRDFCIQSHLPANRLEVIRPGIEIDKIVAAPPADPRPLGLSPASAKICFLGRLDPIKRVDLILKAISLLGRSDVELLIIGDGPQRPKLEGLARELGIWSRVRFLGFREDIPGLLKLCKVSVLASDQEGCSIAITEALAAGIKVIATNVGSAIEQIEEGKTGYVVSPGDPSALAEGISAGLTLTGPITPDLEKLSYRREAKEYLELYQSLL
jgi:glycosyltransferase involved in cell wall biosynthesis